MRRTAVSLLLLAVLLPFGSRAGRAAGSRTERAESGGPPAVGPLCREGECPVCCAARHAHLEMVPFRRFVAYRCPGATTDVRIGFPRGRVRPEDVDALWILHGLDVPLRLTWNFTATTGGQVSVPHEPTRISERRPLPPEAKRLVRPGAHIRWEVVSEDGVHEYASFDVVRSPARLRRHLARLDARLMRHPAWVQRLVAARVLLDAGFPTAAWREAQRVLEHREGEPHASAIHQAALFQVGLDDYENIWIEGTVRADRILHARREAGVRCRVDELTAPDPAWVRREPPRDVRRLRGSCGGC